MESRYDVIIVGGSFGGLAVAGQFESKKVLLLDHKEVGENQTSACGTLLYVPEALGLRESVLQVHPKAYCILMERLSSINWLTLFAL